MWKKYRRNQNKDENKIENKKLEILKTSRYLPKNDLEDNKVIIKKESKPNLIPFNQRNTPSHKTKDSVNFRRFRIYKKENNKIENNNETNKDNRGININKYNNKLEDNKNIYNNNDNKYSRINKKSTLIDGVNEIKSHKSYKMRNILRSKYKENIKEINSNNTDINNNIKLNNEDKDKDKDNNTKTKYRFRRFIFSNNIENKNNNMNNKDTNDNNNETNENKEIKINKVKEIKEIKNQKIREIPHRRYRLSGNKRIEIIKSEKRNNLLIKSTNNQNENNNLEQNNDKKESNIKETLIKKFNKIPTNINLINKKDKILKLENNILNINENENDKEKSVHCKTEKNNDKINTRYKSNISSKNKYKNSFSFLIHQAYENSNLSDTFNKLYESYKEHKKIKSFESKKLKENKHLTNENNENTGDIKNISHSNENSSSIYTIPSLIKENKIKALKIPFFNNKSEIKNDNNNDQKLNKLLEISLKTEENINSNFESINNNSSNKNDSISITNKIINNNTYNTTYNIYKINNTVNKKFLSSKPKDNLMKFSKLIKDSAVNKNIDSNMIINKYKTKIENIQPKKESFSSKTPKKYQEIILNLNKIKTIIINTEKLYIFESRNKAILNKINNYEISYNECHDWIEFYFNNNIYDIFINLFKIKRNKNNIINKIKLEILCLFVCYDASFSKTFCQAGILIKTIFQLLHNNFLIILDYFLKNFVTMNNGQYNQLLINNLNYIINKELKINLFSQEMTNENYIIEIIEQNYKQINNYYKMIIDNLYNYNFIPTSISSSTINDIYNMNNNKIYKFPQCLSLKIDKLNNNQILRIKSLFFFDAYKLLDNYNILDLKIFYDLYLNKKNIQNENLNNDVNNNQRIINIQKNKNMNRYFNILSNKFILDNEKKKCLPSIKSYYRYSLLIDLDILVFNNEIINIFNINKSKNRKIILRPGLINFLQEMKQIYELILFSNNSMDYIKKVLECFGNNEKFFEYILSNNEIKFDKDGSIEDLNLLGRNSKHIIIIYKDQNIYKTKNDNIIYIKPFYGDVQNDGNILNNLTELLKKIKYDVDDSDDIRISLNNYKEEIFIKILT